MTEDRLKLKLLGNPSIFLNQEEERLYHLSASK